jgi:hypothetical protein
MEIEYNNDEETDSRSLGSTNTWSLSEEDDLDTYQSFCLDEDGEGDDGSDYSMTEELNTCDNNT